MPILEFCIWNYCFGLVLNLWVNFPGMKTLQGCKNMVWPDIMFLNWKSSILYFCFTKVSLNFKNKVWENFNWLTLKRYVFYLRCYRFLCNRSNNPQSRCSLRRSSRAVRSTSRRRCWCWPRKMSLDLHNNGRLGNTCRGSCWFHRHLHPPDDIAQDSRKGWPQSVQ